MENVKAWLIADTHFGYKGDDAEWLNDYIGYFEDVLIPQMKEQKGENDILIHCGDVFDNRTTVGLNTLTRVIELFEKLGKIFNDIRIVVGNHDIYKKSTNDITTLNALKYIPNIRIYYKPETDVICGKTCLFNPWVEDLEKEKNILKDANVDYVFGHLDIGGSQMTSRGGVKMDSTSSIGKSDFKSAQVYAGHIHIRQDNGNIHYVGNPYHKDRGDRNNDKGITILDIKTGKTEFIENMVTPKYLIENIYDILNLTIGDLKTRWKNNRIDLHVKSSDIVRFEFDDFISCLTGVFREFNIVSDNVDVLLDTTMAEQTFSDAKSSYDYLNDFFNQQDLEEDFRKLVDAKMEEYKERLC